MLFVYADVHHSVRSQEVGWRPDNRLHRFRLEWTKSKLRVGSKGRAALPTATPTKVVSANKPIGDLKKSLALMT
jgi:hypothetical protein